MVSPKQSNRFIIYNSFYCNEASSKKDSGVLCISYEDVFFSLSLSRDNLLCDEHVPGTVIRQRSTYQYYLGIKYTIILTIYSCVPWFKCFVYTVYRSMSAHAQSRHIYMKRYRARTRIGVPTLCCYTYKHGPTIQTLRAHVRWLSS